MKKKKITFGVIIPESNDDYQKYILEGIKYEADKNDIRLLCFSGSALNKKYPYERNLNSIYQIISKKNIDILIVFTVNLCSLIGMKSTMEYLKKFDIPIVSIGNQFGHYPSVIVDNRSGIDQAIKHLVEVHKCKNIAFIRGPKFNDDANIRFIAYQDALKKYGLTYDKDLVYEGSYRIQDGERAVREFLEIRKVTFDAIIGSDDFCALEIIDTLERYNLKVPADICVIGFDDIPKCQ